MVDYSEQIKRIQEKLRAAKAYDHNFQVFGASSHRYQIGAPVREEEIVAFEKQYGVTLPESYRAFLTEIGNGGPAYMNSAAGPYYGIFPMGEGVDEVVEDPEKYLNRSVVFTKDTLDNVYKKFADWWDEEDCSDEEYEDRMGQFYSGILPIGSQGCTYLHALILNGPDTGRVIYCDMEGYKPRFTFERNFLDWYERWLDEILMGLLTQGGASWFGSTMGGDDTELLKVFDQSETVQEKLDALGGIFKLIQISKKSCDRLLQLTRSEHEDIKSYALQLLTKYSYEQAIEPLKAAFEGDGKKVAIQSLYYYQKKYAFDWAHSLLKILPEIDDPELFRFTNYLLQESKIDYYQQLIPFCTHETKEIREYAEKLLEERT